MGKVQKVLCQFMFCQENAKQIFNSLEKERIVKRCISFRD
ncbi:hypothetical protein SAMN05421730_103918 [Anaerobium acetethylicum]|uniref:Uncharacterized protein n=1 Tax=Anaerobium acetethylicum TaxID=1619234 RepID=A0A1D3TY89_9FIRM|nr:hypothetical protein SAMN05421730_103918 [Anaerobium acetethylicum]